MTQASFRLRKHFPNRSIKFRVIDRCKITKVCIDESRWKFDGTDLDHGLRFAGQPSKAVFRETRLKLRISQSRNDAKITRFHENVAFYTRRDN